jgi:hypothetical protein
MLAFLAHQWGELGMPTTLTTSAVFTVTDSVGRLLRSEEVTAVVHASERLRLAHRNYQAQGWRCDPLVAGRLNFAAERDGKRIVVAIRPLTRGVSPEATRPASGR